MKTKIIVLVFFITAVSNMIYSQDEKDNNQPDERIEVNKEYNEQGNLIRYDSIYSYSSSNSNINRKQMDSIFKNFFPNQNSSFFGNPFGNNESEFPDNFMNIDSILNQRIQHQRSLFDDFFETKTPKKDTTYIRKQGEK
ncbi:hypothetical protein [Aquimarina aggregata]|uniref:hypothetical protein n=1 Tax=Aquimarina aggregata TaxID=1642818 RepID=UPI002492483C|nr:hypothetical protein [Aquimarina aggregata]